MIAPSSTLVGRLCTGAAAEHAIFLSASSVQVVSQASVTYSCPACNHHLRQQQQAVNESVQGWRTWAASAFQKRGVSGLGVYQDRHCAHKAHAPGCLYPSVEKSEITTAGQNVDRGDLHPTSTPIKVCSMPIPTIVTTSTAPVQSPITHRITTPTPSRRRLRHPHVPEKVQPQSQPHPHMDRQHNAQQYQRPTRRRFIDCLFQVRHDEQTRYTGSQHDSQPAHPADWYNAHKGHGDEDREAVAVDAPHIGQLDLRPAGTVRYSTEQQSTVSTVQYSKIKCSTTVERAVPRGFRRRKQHSN